MNFIEAAVKNDGELLRLRVRSLADLAHSVNATAMVPPYVINAIWSLPCASVRESGGRVFTNKATTAPTGEQDGQRQPISWSDQNRIAHELTLDPADVRRRNFIPSNAFPYTTVAGVVHDSGNYQAALERALDLLITRDGVSNSNSIVSRANSWELVWPPLLNYLATTLPLLRATYHVKLQLYDCYPWEYSGQSGVSHNG